MGGQDIEPSVQEQGAWEPYKGVGTLLASGLGERGSNPQPLLPHEPLSLICSAYQACVWDHI